MRVLENVETQIPQTDMREAYLADPDMFGMQASEQAPHYGVRDRLLNTRAGRTISALALTAGFGGAGELALASPASAATAPEAPGQVLSDIENNFSRMHSTAVGPNDIKPVDTWLSAHTLQETGVCDPASPYDPAIHFYLDKPSSLTRTFCFNPNGGTPKTLVQSRGEFIANSQMAKPSNYQPLMNRIGQREARAANVGDLHHGNVGSIHGTPTETDINFRKHSGRHLGWQLKELKVLQRGNRVILKKIKY